VEVIEQVLADVPDDSVAQLGGVEPAAVRRQRVQQRKHDAQCDHACNQLMRACCVAAGSIGFTTRSIAEPMSQGNV
jgi:hypothetical protein